MMGWLRLLVSIQLLVQPATGISAVAAYAAKLQANQPAEQAPHDKRSPGASGGAAASAPGRAVAGKASAVSLIVTRSAMDECESCVALVDYPRVLHSAPFGGLTSTALLLWVIFLIWLLNSTASDFFVPPLVYWSRILHLPPAMAGATLVALGNGAPDFFSLLSATEVSDMSLALSLLLGAMMTDLCVTAGGVLLAFDCPRRAGGKQGASRLPSGGSEGPAAASLVQGAAAQPDGPQAPETVVGKDYAVSAFWLALGVGWLTYLLKDGVVTTGEAICMPLLYAAYLVVLAVTGMGKAADAEAKDAASGEQGSEQCGGQAAAPPPPLDGLGKPENGSPLELVVWAALWPTYAARWIVIPPSDEYWDRSRRVISALAPSAFVAFLAVSYLGGLQALLATPTMMAVTAAAGLCSLCIFLGSTDGPEVPWFYPVLTLLAKASSILVLSVISGELTACVETLGLLNGVPRLWLGTTVVSWGNSLGDLVTGLAMARKGRIRMAFTAVFASPLFNLLCGAGAALTVLAHNSGGSAELWTSPAGRTDLRLHVRFLIATCSLLGLLLVFRRGPSVMWPFSLFILYAVFLVCILTAERAEG